MNTDIEDFINTKNKMGPDDYNNFDVSKWDVQGIKKIFENLLIIYENLGVKYILVYLLLKIKKLIIRIYD